jgi:SEC-C motif-containing protein
MGQEIDRECPCGSGEALADCCGRYHSGGVPPTAEALMRSRYSAYVLKNSGYLRDSWYSSPRPVDLDISHDDTRWQRLVIITTEQGGEADEEGAVEFVAYFQGGQLHERSRFLREGARWFYLDGEILPPLEEKVGRNAPCHCGSGKKFKRCCG